MIETNVRDQLLSITQLMVLSRTAHDNSHYILWCAYFTAELAGGASADALVKRPSVKCMLQTVYKTVAGESATRFCEGHDKLVTTMFIGLML